ncbi:hypothetical protein [uncultured Winogradskyella sp.]|uniref:hypothetical protein n=1 Tax=uncultured Winogradskyella sp. TaxID=395353 RepID=UPI002609038D|nr:hypothetical protein [uncultured Winogradskyella sp.]
MGYSFESQEQIDFDNLFREGVYNGVYFLNSFHPVDREVASLFRNNVKSFLNGNNFQKLYKEKEFKICFEYINSTEFNAFAIPSYKFKGLYHIGLTAGAFLKSFDVFNSILATTDIFENIDGIGNIIEDAIEKVNISKILSEPLTTSPDYSYLLEPGTVRANIALFCQNIAMEYLINHEVAHILNGHLGYLRQKKNSNGTTNMARWNIEYSETLDEKDVKKLEINNYQAMELDADETSTLWSISNWIHRTSELIHPKMLEIDYFLYCRLYIFAVGVVQNIIFNDGSNKDFIDYNESKYPHNEIRYNWIYSSMHSIHRRKLENNEEKFFSECLYKGILDLERTTNLHFDKDPLPISVNKNRKVRLMTPLLDKINFNVLPYFREFWKPYKYNEQMIDEHIFNELKKAVEMSEKELLISIGSLTASDLGAKPPSLSKLLEQGKDWFSNELPEIRKKVCSSERIKYILEMKKTMRTVDVVTVIFSTLTPIYKPLLAVLVSVMVMHHGIDLLCANVS